MDSAAVLIICILMVIVNGCIADSKGYSWVGFGLVILLNWLIPFIILLFLPKREKEEDSAN